MENKDSRKFIADNSIYLLSVSTIACMKVFSSLADYPFRKPFKFIQQFNLGNFTEEFLQKHLNWLIRYGNFYRIGPDPSILDEQKWEIQFHRPITRDLSRFTI